MSHRLAGLLDFSQNSAIKTHFPQNVGIQLFIRRPSHMDSLKQMWRTNKLFFNISTCPRIRHQKSPAALAESHKAALNHRQWENQKDKYMLRSSATLLGGWRAVQKPRKNTSAVRKQESV